jgi:signal transduction histidine kinase
MRTREIFRSTAFRLALAFALAITTAMAAVFALVYLQISTMDVERLRAVLVDEAAKGANESDEDLKRALDLRLTRDLRRLDYVALFSRDGKLVYGNISQLPSIAVDGAAHFVADLHPSQIGDRVEAALCVARKLPDGGVLVLGRSLAEVYAIRATVLRALVTGLAPTIILALAIGAFFARAASRRLLQIHETIARIMTGDLDARLPVGKGTDDIDEVTAAVNLMLDEIVRLLDQLKSVGDNIAHDLRTPLAVVRAKLERGLENESSFADLRKAATEALDQLEKAMATVSALLRISAVENGLRSKAFTEIDLTRICDELVEFYEPLAQSKSIAMTLHASGATPMLGDADLLREALSNLIDNAIKFSPADSAIVVEAKMAAGKPLVRVSDSGCGVAPEDREKIFQRFYRAPQASRLPGHGLGLSIARTIANLHGFDLTVTDNHPGACFEFSARVKQNLVTARRVRRASTVGA